jgi:phenylacetate-coenzyme A ligase PaaK-like adenylate-forming protein
VKTVLTDIRQILEQTVRSFPWYLPLLDAEQEKSAELTLEELPLITSSVLEAHYYSEHNPMTQSGGLQGYRTSGTSSGRRKTIFYSSSDEEHYIRIKLNVLREILGSYHFRTAMSDMGTGHAEATAVEVLSRLGMKVKSISFQLPIEQHIEQLTRFQPEVLYTMPSILDRILQKSSDPRAFGIRHVLLVGEIAAPSWIRQVADRLGIAEEQITDTYGSIEIGTIAYYSHEHKRYLLAEGLISEGISPEAIGENLEPLPDRQEQVLVLTSIVREAFPALRYVTYDVVRDLRPILVDGTLRQSFQSIVKRIGPDLKHGEKISIYDIENVVFRHLSKASVRVKVSGNALIVHVWGPKAETSVLESIRSDMENQIPEIGTMIRAGILDGIQVFGGAYEDSLYHRVIKNKKIFYE